MALWYVLSVTHVLFREDHSVPAEFLLLFFLPKALLRGFASFSLSVMLHSDSSLAAKYFPTAEVGFAGWSTFAAWGVQFFMCKTKPVTKMSVLGMSWLEILMTFFFHLASELSCQFRGWKLLGSTPSLLVLKYLKLITVLSDALYAVKETIWIWSFCLLLSCCGFQGSSELKLRQQHYG